MRFSKTVRVFAWSFLAIFSLIVAMSAVLSLFYQKAIVRYMQKYLHEHLVTELSMKEIRFSVLKGFPNATVEIIKPVMLSGEDFNVRDFPGTYADTLLEAKSVSFQFDLLKLINGQYELKKIEVTEGHMNILLDKNNRHNLKVWKAGENQTGEAHSVNLRSIFLNNTRIRVVSIHEQFNLSAFTRRSMFKGSYSGHILLGDTRGAVALDSLVVKNKRLIKDASLHMALKMAYGMNRFRISQGRIHFNKALINVSGEYKSGKENIIDLTLSIPKFGLDELMSLLPVSTKAVPASLNFTGNGKLTAVIKGSLTNKDNLLIRSSFELNGCTARNTDTRAEIRNIKLKGSISGTRADNFELRLDQFGSDLGKGTIAGKLTLRDLNALSFRAEILSTLDLQALPAEAPAKTTKTTQPDASSGGSSGSTTSTSPGGS